MADISTIRSKALKKNVYIMMLIRGLSFLISFLYVPLLYGALDTNSYGVWLTLTSLVAWVAMFDIGLGNGLRNKLAESLALGEVDLAKKYVSTAYVYIALLVSCLIAVFYIVRGFVPWNSVLNATEIDISTLQKLVSIVYTTFCVRFALNIINSVMLAMQQPAMSSGLALIEQMIAYIIVFVLVKIYNVTSLLILGTVISVVPIVVLIVATLTLFLTKYRHISPTIACSEYSKTKDILSLGVRFFVIQIGTLILFQSNNLIIIHVVGDAAVVEYNIAYKYMHTLIMVFNIIVTPIWSATTDAYVRGDFDWIKSTNKKMVIITVLMSVVGFIMLMCSSWFYRLWFGDSPVDIPFSISALLYLYMVAMMMYGCYGYFINGFGHLRLQMIVSVVLSVLYPVFAIYAGKSIGVEGVLVVFTLTTFVSYLWSKIQYTKIVNRTASGIWLK
jgi:O-antigen/teichoic acid export membrane protein